MKIINNNNNERDELHRAIWSIADELRGSVDGWDFKNYVLGIMFYRYISENLTGYINKDEKDAGNIDFDYFVFMQFIVIYTCQNIIFNNNIS